MIILLINIQLKKCVTIISENLSSIRYVPDEYKTQQIVDKADDDCLTALIFLHDWFVLSIMIKNFLLICMVMKIYATLMKILPVLYFPVMKYVFLIIIDLNDINLDDTSYEEDDLDTIILIRLLAWHNKFQKHKNI